jgi:hypothetical protein
MKGKRGSEDTALRWPEELLCPWTEAGLRDPEAMLLTLGDRNGNAGGAAEFDAPSQQITHDSKQVRRNKKGNSAQAGRARVLL